MFFLNVKTFNEKMKLSNSSNKKLKILLQSIISPDIIFLKYIEYKLI